MALVEMFAYEKSAAQQDMFLNTHFALKDKVQNHSEELANVLPLPECKHF